MKTPPLRNSSATHKLMLASFMTAVNDCKSIRNLSMGFLRVEGGGK